MNNLDELIRDHFKYCIKCSRCGVCYSSLTEMLDIIPNICGNCNNTSYKIAFVKKLTNDN